MRPKRARRRARRDRPVPRRRRRRRLPRREVRRRSQDQRGWVRGRVGGDRVRGDRVGRVRRARVLVVRLSRRKIVWGRDGIRRARRRRGPRARRRASEGSRASWAMRRPPSARPRPRREDPKTPASRGTASVDRSLARVRYSHGPRRCDADGRARATRGRRRGVRNAPRPRGEADVNPRATGVPLE